MCAILPAVYSDFLDVVVVMEVGVMEEEEEGGLLS